MCLAGSGQFCDVFVHMPEFAMFLCMVDCYYVKIERKQLSMYRKTFKQVSTSQQSFKLTMPVIVQHRTDVR